MKQYLPRRYDGPSHDERFIPRPVIGLDIDGTLGAYHEHFTKFAEGWLGRPLPSAEGYTGGPFWRYLGLSRATYRKVKLAYRRGGLKRSMPVIAGAESLTRSLRSRGAVVVLCTTRPYLSMENIDEDTRHWAKRNKVAHDSILWGEHKYRDLTRTFGRERIVATLDDEPALACQSFDCGITTLLVDQPYNKDTNIARMHGLEEAESVLHHLLDCWEKEHR